MISILLTILKITGIVLLALLLFVLLLLLLVLFVPVRYTIKADRGVMEAAPMHLRVKASWLLHLVNVCFDHPRAAYVRVRIAFVTIYRSDKRKKEAAGQPEPSKVQKDASEEGKEEDSLEIRQEPSKEQEALKAEEDIQEKEDIQERETHREKEDAPQKEAGEAPPTKRRFFQKLFLALKNIQYTISEIYDKIKQIGKDIRYYIRLIQSETFRRAYETCRKEIVLLLKGVCPKKVRGSLMVGTGDPAGTGQVLAAYGILYPLIGNNIVITPDFERQVLEGELFIKGRIRVIRLLRTAWKIYFNKDIRRVLKLLKREAA